MLKFRNMLPIICDDSLLNVVQMGFAFMFIFTAVQSCFNIQETVLHSVHNQTGRIEDKAGYYSLSILLGSWMIFNFFAAALVEVFTAKWSMVIGGFCYLVYFGSFFHIRTAFLYSASVLQGIGGSMIWIGQGYYLAKNSNDESMGRNSAIIFSMMQCSLPIGGIFLYTQFRDVEFLSDATINVIYITFTCLTVIGILILALLRRPPTRTITVPLGKPVNDLITPIDSEHDTIGTGVIRKKADFKCTQVIKLFWQSFVSTFRLWRTLPMMILSIAFTFVGLKLAFWSGIYGTSLAFTKAFGESSKGLMALHSIFLGCGEVAAGIRIGIIAKKYHKQIGRSPIILCGMLSHFVAFILIFINIPSLALLSIFGALAYFRVNYFAQQEIANRQEKVV